MERQHSLLENPCAYGLLSQFRAAIVVNCLHLIK
ncbi:virulence promoting factor [Escherichia coli]|nr:virulence promoting factor [Escherichia coli]